MEIFDTGFTHEYPASKGATEELIAGRRLLITDNSTDLSQDQKRLTLPFEQNSYRYYFLPMGARGLQHVVRLLRNPRSTVEVGRLLGLKLAAVNTYFGGTPSDTILPRFTVYGTEEKSSLKFGGNAMSLLPPFEMLDNNIEESMNVLEKDLINARGSIDIVAQDFIQAVKSGFNHVG